MSSGQGPWSLPAVLTVGALDVAGVVVMVMFSVILGICLILLGGVVTTAVLFRHQAGLPRQDPK